MAAPYSATTVANRFIELANEKSEKLTPMQIIKLTYIAHGFALAINNRPLLNESVEAWRYGPVVPSLYRLLKHYGSGFVEKPINVMFGSTLDKEDEKLIDLVYQKYGQFTGVQLSYLTHRVGTPWEKAYRADHYGIDLDNAEIQSHYESLLRK